MRHRKHRSKLNRTSEHRGALMRNLTIALVEHERIQTTQAKASQLRPFVEKLITLARENSLHARRLAVARIQDKPTVIKMFDELAPRVGDRPGGYLRIVKSGPRAGDGAPMAFIEFVDAAPVSPDENKPQRKTVKQRLHERRKEVAKARKAGAGA
jgi:large subunit ribosomal protein L17